MELAFVCLPALLLAGAFVIWAIQRLLGQSEEPFWG